MPQQPKDKAKAKTKTKPKTKVKTFRAALKRAAGPHRGGQGYQSMNFDGEQRIVNRGLEARCMPPTDPYHDAAN